MPLYCHRERIDKSWGRIDAWLPPRDCTLGLMDVSSPGIVLSVGDACFLPGGRLRHQEGMHWERINVSNGLSSSSLSLPRPHYLGVCHFLYLTVCSRHLQIIKRCYYLTQNMLISQGIIFTLVSIKVPLRLSNHCFFIFSFS